MINETRKILSIPDLPVSATCVRIPVERGHAVSIRATFAKPFELDRVRQLLAKQPGLVVVDDPSNPMYPTTTQAIDTNDV